MILYQVAKSLESRRNGGSEAADGELEPWLLELIAAADAEAKSGTARQGQVEADPVGQM